MSKVIALRMSKSIQFEILKEEFNQLNLSAAYKQGV